MTREATTGGFADEAVRRLGEAGWRGLSPATLLDAWAAFVAKCEREYDWSIYEYENDLGVRDRIERVLTGPVLRARPEAAETARQEDPVDARFRTLLLPDARPGDAWWTRGPFRAAGEQYAHVVADAYGVQVAAP